MDSMIGGGAEEPFAAAGEGGRGDGFRAVGTGSVGAGGAPGAFGEAVEDGRNAGVGAVEALAAVERARQDAVTMLTQVAGGEVAVQCADVVHVGAFQFAWST